MLNPFYYKNDTLYCENVSLQTLAQQTGTPFYVYSQSKLESNLDTLIRAIPETVSCLICYALKANSNPALIKILAGKGCGAEVVSGGELELALQSVPPERIVFSGVGKTDPEIERAIAEKIYCLNIESLAELNIVNAIAEKMKKTISVAIRINPDINPKTHPYISTGLKESKFGIEMAHAEEAFRLAVQLPNLDLTGVHCHIGSMINSVEPYKETVRILKRLILSLKKNGTCLKHIDIGGGLAVQYENIIKNKYTSESGRNLPPSPEELFKTIWDDLKALGLKIVFEPGRYLVANTAALVSRVIVTKSNGDKNFIVIDAGMNDLIRPSLYNAFHQIVPVQDLKGKPEIFSVVGPVCESGDFFANDRPLPRMNRDDLLAVLAAGAYGYTLTSNYNGRPRPPEILVTGSEFIIIRQREKIQDLWKDT